MVLTVDVGNGRSVGKVVDGGGVHLGGVDKVDVGDVGEVDRVDFGEVVDVDCVDIPHPEYSFYLLPWILLI